MAIGVALLKNFAQSLNPNIKVIIRISFSHTKLGKNTIIGNNCKMSKMLLC